jgi:diguanylate cyclase (GGDEF)-like protein
LPGKFLEEQRLRADACDMAIEIHGRGDRARLWTPSLTVAALALAGIWGCLIGLIELRQAVSQSQDLYRLDTGGSQIESDLEFQTQESRLAFLSASAGTPEAEEQVRGTIQRFQQLDAPGAIEESIQDFETSWRIYTLTVARSPPISGFCEPLCGPSLALLHDDPGRSVGPALPLQAKSDEGRADRAGPVPILAGDEAFLAAMRDLRVLKQALKDHARAQSSRVEQSLRQCFAGFISFVVAIFLILLRLLRRGIVRARALLFSGQELERAQELARRRVAILEMVVTHAPLAQTLAAIAELPFWSQAGAGAALWSVFANTLFYQASAGLPEPMTNSLRSLSLQQPAARAEIPSASKMAGPRPASCMLLGAESRREIEELASRADLSPTVVPLQDVTGDAIGLLLLFVPAGASVIEIPQTVSSQMAQLASLAIVNARLYERLAFQAQHDILTGLPNRFLFQDRVQQAILRARRNRRKVGVLWFDLDRFKHTNDTLGRRVGDELLCEFARRIESSLRKTDTAARIGGDEFVVLVADLENASDFRVIAEKLLKQIRTSMVVSGHELRISASAGISVYPDHGREPAGLMRNADLAMHQAKRAGRDTFRMYHKELNDSLGRRLRIEQELKCAAAAGEFHLVYQPLIGRQDELVGFEALLRWNSRTFGQISPAEFIPIAEEAGLILGIGEWVTQAACREGARWIKQGMDVPSIAVNASGLQFADGHFPAMVRKALAESGFPPSKLEIEVTETALAGNLESALKQITRLRELGIRFAIDDFGTGYSSLNRLRTLPVDCVKVDRSFIKDLERSSGDSTTLVRGIIGMAHSLRLRVVAEGVETSGQLAILRSLGCDVSQGYYLHRPLLASAAEELMKGYLTTPRPAFCGDVWGAAEALVHELA